MVIIIVITIFPLVYKQTCHHYYHASVAVEAKLGWGVFLPTHVLPHPPSFPFCGNSEHEELSKHTPNRDVISVLFLLILCYGYDYFAAVPVPFIYCANLNE